MSIWKPDTCGCVFEFDDATVDPAIGIPGSGTVVGGKPCPDHNALADDETRRQAVAAENMTRQDALHAISYALGWRPAIMHPRVTDVVLVPEQNPLFRPLAIPHGFDANRNIVILTADLVADGADETVIQNVLRTLPAPKHSSKAPITVDRGTRVFPSATDAVNAASGEDAALTAALAARLTK